MNVDKIENTNEEVLKIVNEDWPMLEELGKKRFVIKNKKAKDVKESLNILKAVLDEEVKLEETQEVEESNFIGIPKVQEEKVVVVAQEVQKNTSSQNQRTATTTTQSEVVAPLQQEIEQVKTEKVNIQQPVQNFVSTKKQVVIEKTVVTEKSIDLFKLIFAGLTFLYVSKTSKLLKPLKFVMENYKEVSVAALHFIMPLLMTYFITTHMAFVTEQLAKETILMKSVYIGVFFFGSTFVWISSQVLLSGMYAMIRKSMLDVAKIGKENQ